MLDMTEFEFSQNNAKNFQDNISYPTDFCKKPQFKAKNEMPFFIMDEESINKLEEGKAHVELILDSRNDNWISDNTLKALQKDRLGSYEEKPAGEITLKFPEKYLDLITRRQKERKLPTIVLIKQDSKRLIPPTKKLTFSSKVQNQVLSRK